MAVAAEKSEPQSSGEMARMADPTEATKPFIAPRWPVSNELTMMVSEGKAELPPMPRHMPITTRAHHRAGGTSRTYRSCGKAALTREKAQMPTRSVKVGP